MKFPVADLDDVTSVDLILSFRLTLTSILKPFEYAFPIVPSLPLSSMEIFNSPFPMIVGLNISKD